MRALTTRECVVNRILELCMAKNMTISALARSSGLPPSTVKNIINGVSRNPGIVTLKQICDGLDVSLTDFFDTQTFRNLEQEMR